MTSKATFESTYNVFVGRVRVGFLHAYQACVGFIPRGAARVRELAPYAVIELILPGGSIIALSLWYLQRKRTARIGGSPPL